MSAPSSPASERLAGSVSPKVVLAAILLGRLAVNMQYRVIYPYLPAISRGLGVTLATASLLITARSLAGLTSPWYGRLSDRYGRKSLMIVGLLAVVAGTGLMAITPSFGWAVLAFVILGFARASYDPAAQAHISDLVPYDRRGRALGLVELPWSAAWLIGVPIAGLLIARAGWQSPFAWLAVFGAICLVFVGWTRFPAAPKGRGFAGGSVTMGPVAFQLTRPMVAAFGVSALLGLANVSFFIISGAWLESQFGLAVGALGLVFGITGFAELAAELLSAGVLDRIGKVRALFAGLMLNALAYILLPRLSLSLFLALVGLSFVILTAEFSIVSVLSPLSELAPEMRGTVLALNSALMAGGTLVASLVAPRLWEAGGLSAVSTFSAAAICAALLLLWLVRWNAKPDGL